MGELYSALYRENDFCLDFFFSILVFSTRASRSMSLKVVVVLFVVVVVVVVLVLETIYKTFPFSVIEVRRS